MPGEYLTPYRRRQIVRAYERGYSTYEIAEAMGISTGTSWRWVRRHLDGEGLQNRERPPVPKCKLRPEVQDRICELWQDGMQNYAAIAREVTPLQHPRFGQGKGSQAVCWESVKKVLQLRGLL